MGVLAESPSLIGSITTVRQIVEISARRIDQVPFAGLGVLLLGVTLLTGCGCACVTQESNVPYWFRNPPEDPNFVYGSDTDAAQKMQAALDTAMAGTRKDFATSLDSTLIRYTQNFADTLDDRLNQQFAEVREETLDTLAEEVSPKKKKVYKQDDGTWRAFILIEMPVSEAAQALLAGLETHEKLHTRFRKSPVYREMTEPPEEKKKRR